jgi:class 3 adenylate cyclase/alpha-beta hydrolase superfamily lysophospholipase
VRPRTRYVTVQGRSVAYQTFGEPGGARCLCIVWNYLSHLDWVWADPDIARLLRRAGTQGRVVMYDRGGVGLSDPVAVVPSMEERAEELLAVVDAAGLQRFDLVGVMDGAAVAAFVAATRPERVLALALLNPWVKGRSDGREPPGVTEWSHEQWQAVIDDWGEGRSLDFMFPSLDGSPLHRRIMATFERTAGAPGTIRALAAAARTTDVTAVLPAIGAPTLVIANRGDRVLPIEQARFVAEAIPGARLAELDGIDASVQYEHGEEVTVLFDEHFRTDAGRRDPERVFRAVLFSDIVGSTGIVARLGDAGWADVRRRHDAITRTLVDRHGGTEVKSTGDGFLVTFPSAEGAVACGLALVDAVRPTGLEVRVGVHAGELRLAADEDITGMTVHVAARICSAAGAGEVLISQAARDLAEGAHLVFADRGGHELRGATGRWRLYAAGGGDRPAVEPSADLASRSDRVQQAIVRRAPALGRGIARIARRRGARRG